MPLSKGKSEKSFAHNVKAEMHAGKPQKQALAIAFDVKRKAQHKAMGGVVEPSEDHDMLYAHHIAEAIRHKKAMRMADGGEVESQDELEMPGEEHEEFLAPDMEEAEEQDPKEKMKSRLKGIFSR